MSTKGNIYDQGQPLHDFQSKPTVINYLLDRLSAIGVEEVFGVPGDYAFSINDAILEHKKMRWIGSCNELNAAYSADGYARIKGVGCVNTTFGVGELSAANGIAGAYAESLPVFHIVGLPESDLLKTNLPIHHTFGDGNFSVFQNVGKQLTCAHAILNEDNVSSEVERVITAALYESKPAYFGIPIDTAEKLVDKEKHNNVQIAPKQSNPLELRAAVKDILDRSAHAKNVVVFPGFYLQRYKVVNEVLDFLEQSKLPFAKLVGDKGVINEAHPSFLGLFLGPKASPKVNDFVQKCDLAIMLGTIQSDRNTGGFSFKIDESKAVDIMPTYVRCGERRYEDVLIKDMVHELTKQLKNRNDLDIESYRECCEYGEPLGYKDNQQLNVEYLYKMWEGFFKPKDIIVQETGLINMAMHFTKLPQDAQIQASIIWRSIGWATPASFGVAMAAQRSGHRTILICGDGAHQLSAQEVCNFYRYGLKPIIFLINNAGYTVERVLGNLYDREYNDITNWSYKDLPAVFGCKDWITEKVSTVGEIQKALKRIETEDKAAYIEVIIDRDDVPPSFKAVQEKQFKENKEKYGKEK